MPTAHTDDALDTLRILFPDHPTATLERYLAASNGDLARAHAAIERGALDDRPTKRKRVKGSGGLEAWLGGGKREQEVVVLSDSDDEGKVEVEGAVEPEQGVARDDGRPKKPLKSAYDLLKPSVASFPSFLSSSSSSSSSFSSSAAPPAPPQATHINLPPLRLTSADQIAHHTAGLVTLVENALPVELAARLFVELVRESKGEGSVEYRGQPWQPNKWWLVDREVTSPHTSCFYRERPEKLDAKKGYDAGAFDEAAQYWYNGVPRTSRTFTPSMDSARDLVGAFVRTLLDARGERHPMEWQGAGGWEPNVAAANCYRGKTESVGWHSDVLQYLGPYATIASLTLGVGRPFRLRPFIPSSPPPSSSVSSSAASPAQAPLPVPALRTLEIFLPHNSLLIMHGGCQEAFKHCVPPVSGGMDVFRVPRGVLAAGPEGEEEAWKMSEEEVRRVEETRFVERINLTFRHYRPDFAPLPSSSFSFSASLSAMPPTSSTPSTYAGSPLCKCGVPCTLRPDGRGRIRAKLASTLPSLAASSSSVAPSPAPSTSIHHPDTHAIDDDDDLRARTGDPSKGDMLFFWTCNAAAQNEGKGCNTWRVLDMKREGRGRWFGPGLGTDLGEGKAEKARKKAAEGQ